MSRKQYYAADAQSVPFVLPDILSNEMECSRHLPSTLETRVQKWNRHHFQKLPAGDQIN